MQDEISEIAGLSRQTYSALETRKRKMTWSNFMTLLVVFYSNPATKETLENTGFLRMNKKGFYRLIIGRYKIRRVNEYE